MTTPPTLPLPVIIDAEVDPPPPSHRHRQLRANGWTAARQAGFLAVLAVSGSVREAAAAVGMSREGAYRLRDHPDAHEFRAAWAGALAHGFGQLAEYALERVLQGETVTVRRDDGRSFTRHQPASDRLVLALLHRFEAHLAPHGFTTMPAPLSAAEQAARLAALPDATGWGDAVPDLDGPPAPLPRRPVLLTPDDISAADVAPKCVSPDTAHHRIRSRAPRVETPQGLADRLHRKALAAARSQLMRAKFDLSEREQQLAAARANPRKADGISWLERQIRDLRQRRWELAAELAALEGTGDAADAAAGEGADAGADMAPDMTPATPAPPGPVAQVRML